MRPDKDDYFMTMAWAASRRSTCFRRAVGCVLVNGLGHIVGTGYNGRPRGMQHCNDEHEDPQGGYVNHAGNKIDFPFACKAAFDAPASKPLSCEAVHAEVNSLMQCYDVLWVRTAYVTRSPCTPCTKVLLNSGCQRIVYAEESSDVKDACELWTRNNSALGGDGSLRQFHHFSMPNPFKRLRR